MVDGARGWKKWGGGGAFVGGGVIPVAHARDKVGAAHSVIEVLARHLGVPVLSPARHGPSSVSDQYEQ